MTSVRMESVYCVLILFVGVRLFHSQLRGVTVTRFFVIVFGIDEVAPPFLIAGISS